MSGEFANGYITIARTSQYANRLRSIDVFIDGQKVGEVKNGENKAFELRPGAHKVFAKIDWCKTCEVDVTVRAGETEELLCGSELEGWKSLLAIIYLFMPNKYIYLKHASGA